MRVFIPTCETAVSTIPEWHRADLKGDEELVTSPLGWSPGALNLAQGLAMKLHAPLLHADMTRLLIDISKHPDDNSRWSHLSEKLTDEQRQRLDERQKKKYLAALRERISIPLKRADEVIHFTADTQPDLDPAWITFEYDSSRIQESAWVKEWIAALSTRLPQAVIREISSPTRSLAGYLRSQFPENFSSVRIIIAQSSFLLGQPIRWTTLKKELVATIPR